MKWEDLPETVDVLIVGAGPTGLTVAMNLKKYGIDALCIDDRDRIEIADSKCTSVQTRTIEIFEELGITERVIDEQSKVYGLIFRRLTGDKLKPFMSVTDQHFRTDSAFAYALSCPQWKIETSILEALRERGGDVLFSTRLESFEQDDDGVNAQMVHRPSGEKKTIRARYIAGCDGVRSTVRDQLNIQRTGRVYKDFFIIADIHVKFFNYALDKRHTVCSDEHHIHIAPLGDQFFRMFITIHDGYVTAEHRNLWTGTCKPDDDAWKATMAWFQARVDEYGLPWRLYDPVRFSTYEVFLGYANHAGKGRAFLAGDAGHSHSPHGGQGMNTGVQDGHNLAWKLALTLRGEMKDIVLQSYITEREAIWHDLVERTDTVKNVVERRSSSMRLITDWMLPMLPDPFYNEVARRGSQLTLRYEESELNCDEWPSSALGSLAAKLGRAIRVGERAPDGICQLMPTDGDALRTRLHRVLYGGGKAAKFMLLFFVDQSNPTPDFSEYEGFFDALSTKIRAESIEAYAVVPDGTKHFSTRLPALIDTEGELAERYGAHKGGVFILRPDAYIAYRHPAFSHESLLRYLSRLFHSPATTSTKEGKPAA